MPEVEGRLVGQMNIALFFWDRLPALTYGGTQRMILYLARGLAAAGHRVTLVAGEGSRVPETTLVPVDLKMARRSEFDIRRFLPNGLDILLSYAPLRTPPEIPEIPDKTVSRPPVGNVCVPVRVRLTESLDGV